MINTSNFLQNKYTKWYYNIIAYRKQQLFDGYTEKHHIIPLSMGGSNKQQNLVKLTAREHFICHLLLTRMCSDQKDKNKMMLAVHAMQYWHSPNQARDFRIGSRCFEALKILNSKAVSERFMGIPKSDQQRLKMSEANKGKHNHQGSNNPMYGKKHSDAVCKAARVRLAKTNSLRKWYNNGIQNLFSIEHPGADWILGRLMKPTTKGHKWYNNGVQNICSSTHPGDDWVIGMLK